MDCEALQVDEEKTQEVLEKIMKERNLISDVIPEVEEVPNSYENKAFL